MPRGLVPPPHRYAVIRTDPEAMVVDLGLDDPDTLKEAQGMLRKKYLVYLEWPDELPMPGMRWCRYSVSPIGTTLRPPDEMQGITPDMVVPIAPNQGLNPERHPVHPTPSFPFSNCYHWIFNKISVRIRVHPEGVEHGHVPRLLAAEHLALKDAFSLDCRRINAFRYEKYGPPSGSGGASEQEGAAVDASSACEDDAEGTGRPVETSPHDGDRTHVLSDTYYRLVTQRGLRQSGPPSYCDEDSSSEDISGSRDSRKRSPVTAVTSRDEGVDLFGWNSDPNTAKIPLVDAWLDLENHLTEDSITDPLELKKEIEQIDALITRGLVRFASAQKSPEQIKDECLVSDAELPVEPDELADDDHWVEVINGLWDDLQFNYAASSSCGPPFLELHIPESDCVDDAPSIPRHTTGHNPSPLPSYPLPGDMRSLAFDVGACTSMGTSTPPPVSTDSDPAPSRASASSGPRTPSVESALPPLASFRMSSSKNGPRIRGAVVVALPPSSSRASTMYSQMRTKVAKFWHTGRRRLH